MDKKKGLISNMWLILSYTVQLVIPDVCTKFNVLCQAVAVKCLIEKSQTNKPTNIVTEIPPTGGIKSTGTLELGRYIAELRTIRTLDNSDLGQFGPDSDLSCGQFGPWSIWTLVNSDLDHWSIRTP